MAIYGRSGTDSDVGIIQNAARASVFDPMPENGWGYRMGAKLGRYVASSGTASVRLAIWDTAGTGGSPDDYLGRTDPFNVSNVASYSAECNAYLQNITDTSQAHGMPADTGVMLYSGRTYAMGYVTTGGSLMHQMVQAANASYDNENFYNKSVGSTIPPDPFAASSSSFEGMLNVYIEYEPNTAPNKPTTGLAPSGTITGLTPTFTATFTDGNTDRGDYLSNIDIEVRIVGTSTYKWDTSFEPGTGESGGLNRVYGGSALSAGVNYEWRVRFADAFGAWGAWSDYTAFTINAGGSVATPTSPSGKQETNTPTPFSAVWSHGTPLSTNAAEVRIKQGTTVVRGPFQKAVTVANGGTISFTWAETGFAALEWGKSYTVEIRGRDTGGLWSEWSTGRAFDTNAYPTVPTSLSPANGATVSALPLLTFVMTDADDTTATGLTAEVRIKNAAGTLLFTRTATFDAALNKWKYQTTSTDFASFATYKWDARGLDGTLNSAYSTEYSIVYGAGPNVTGVSVNGVAANGATPPTNTPVITWTVTGSTQQSFRVQLYASPYVVGDTPVYDSGTVVSAVASHTVPSGYLHNGSAYDLILTVTNTVPLAGTFGPYTFTVTFPAPTPIAGFQASPIAVAGDIAGQTSAILLGWKPPDDAPATFIENIITRLRQGIPDTETILARLPTMDQTTFVDYFPRTGEVYEYRIYKVVYQGTDITESAASSANASVSFDHTIIQSATNPSARRVALRVTRTASVDHKGEQTVLFPWGETKPTIIVSPVNYDVISGSYMLYTTVFQNAEDALDSLESMRDAYEVVCYRDERGKKAFGYLQYKEDYSEMRRYVISLSVTESNFREGVT